MMTTTPISAARMATWVASCFQLLAVSEPTAAMSIR